MYTGLWKMLFFFVGCVNAADIYLRDYGAYVSGESGTDEAVHNGVILFSAFQNAERGDRIILSDTDIMYYVPYSYVSDLQDISFVLDGEMILHDNISAWGFYEETDSYFNAIDIRNSRNITITGSGRMDGQGTNWWLGFLRGTVSRRRPTMIDFTNGIDILIENITMTDSPRFHVYCGNVLRLEVRYLTIWVDMHYVFPYNTDGIDFNGKDIYIHDSFISNYDDSVCVKPSRSTTPSLDGEIMTCSENILVENINVYLGAGLSVGSVSSMKHNCIRNVTFQNIHAKYPLKFIYIKTGELDGAEDIEGTIEDITYRNMTAHGAVVWPIYIGPQQQNEPDGTGDGVWPAVNPEVSIRNILLEDVAIAMKDKDMAPGVLRCNATNPCIGLEFRNVEVDTSRNYVCSDPGSLVGVYDSASSPELGQCGLNLS